MPWLAVDFFPGFAADLTCWRAEFDLGGAVVQFVREWPSGRELELRSELAASDAITLQRIVERLDFDLLADRRRIPSYVDDFGHVTVSNTHNGLAREFTAQLPFWEWNPQRGHLKYSEYPGIEAAVQLWFAIRAVVPYGRPQN